VNHSGTEHCDLTSVNHSGTEHCDLTSVNHSGTEHFWCFTYIYSSTLWQHCEKSPDRKNFSRNKMLLLYTQDLRKSIYFYSQTGFANWKFIICILHQATLLSRRNNLWHILLWGELRFSGRVISSCSTCGTHRVTLVANSVISHEWRKFRIVIKTNNISVIIFDAFFCTPKQNCLFDMWNSNLNMLNDYQYLM
jgi:hypothetical protein